MQLPTSAILLSAAVLLLPGISRAQHTAAPAAQIAPSTAKDMCAALSVADFAKAGVPMAVTGMQSSDDSTNAYCGYKAKNGTAEFDIFYPAGDTAAAAIGTERTIYGEVGGRFQPIAVPGTDSAQINLSVPGKKPAAAIVVRRGFAVFALYIPPGPNARQQLLSLSQTVLARLQPRDKPAK